MLHHVYVAFGIIGGFT